MSTVARVFGMPDSRFSKQKVWYKARQLLQSSEPHHRSLATAITRDRIALINKKRKKKITLDIIDLKDETGNATGTLVRFRIPAKTLC